MSVVSAQKLFSDLSDPKRYVPRPATEDIIRSLSSLVRDGEPAIVLRGPPGIGKSMLLQVLAERLSNERRVAYASVSSTPELELCHRVLELLEEPETDDPAEALISAARLAADGHRRLLLLIDHAERTPIASRQQLVAAATTASPHLTVIFAVCEGQAADDFIQALEAQSCGIVVAYDQVMNEDEALAYVRSSLTRGEIPEDLQSRLDPSALAWIIAGTNGLPREINGRAIELLDRYERGEDPLVPVTPEQDFGEQPSPGDPLRSDPRPSDDGGPTSGSAAAESAPLPGLGGILLGHRKAPVVDPYVDLDLRLSLGSSAVGSSPRPRVDKPDRVPVELPEGMPQGQSPTVGRKTDDLQTPSFGRSLLLAFSFGAILGAAIAAGYLVGRLQPQENEPAAIQTLKATTVES